MHLVALLNTFSQNAQHKVPVVWEKIDKFILFFNVALKLRPSCSLSSFEFAWAQAAVIFKNEMGTPNFVVSVVIEIHFTITINIPFFNI